MPDVGVADLGRDWSFDPAAALVVAVGSFLYVLGVRRLASKGRAWSPARSLTFAGAIATIVVATQSGVATHEADRFAVHMVQHVLLGMLAPALLALSAPVTLLLQSGRPATTLLARRLLRSRAGALAANPILTWAVFGGSLVGLYLTSALDVAARNDAVHAAIHAHVFVAGCLFLWPLIGSDVLPHRLAHGARLLVVLVAVPFHAFLGVALTTASSPVAPAAYPNLADQRTAAGVLWASGELLTLAVAAVVFQRWSASGD